jgi:DNA-binding LytR/AlgR family response regulator
MAKARVNILVVEDEILLAQDIALRLSKHYHVVGTAVSVEEAITLLNDNPETDIILSDIKLEGKQDGIDLGEIVNEKYHLPFIFLTSHSDQALVERAKEVKPASYLLKPFNDREIPIAIELALANFERQEESPKLHQKESFAAHENQVMNISDRLFLKKDHHFQRVALKDISLLEADGNYTTIYAQEDKYIYSTQLKYMEEKLPTDRFIRVHRSHVINIDAVEGWEGNTLFVQEKRIVVSKQYREKVFSIFNPF